MNGLALCAGVGGLELGVGLACADDYRTVCYVEREAYAAAILAARMADTLLAPAPIWDDLTTFDGKPWRGVVDIVTAGYPCQPFSHAGKRSGVDDERHLWPHVFRIWRECGAVWLFCENVPGHLTLGFDEVCRDLQGVGARVAAGIFSAAEVGAPHRRERLFFLALAHGDDAGHDGGGSQGHRGQPQPEPAGGCVPAWPPGPAADWSGVPEELWPAVGNGASQRPCVCSENSQGQQTSLLGEGLVETGKRPEATQPPLRGVADGLASRVDRLRACGNGVVPLVAAHALRTLAAELTDA